MKKSIKYIIGSFCLTLLLIGCIKNDIPYPVRKASITAIEFRGQRSVEMDLEKKIVNVVLEDTTNINQVIMSKFEVTENTTVTPSVLDLPMMLDLEKDVVFSLHTYQQYDWTIKTTQPVARSAKFEGQVGNAHFYESENSIVVYVTQSVYEHSDDMTVESLILGPSNSTISPDPTTIRDFSIPQTFTVVKHGKSTVWTVNVLPASASLVTEEPLETRAYYTILAASVALDAGAELGFEYKKAGESDYHKLTGDDLAIDGGIITARLVTDPDTRYFYRVYQGEDVGSEVSFYSDPTPSIPYLSTASDWYKNGKTWYPCKESEYGDGEAYRGFWNTGNKGVTLFKDSNVYPMTETGMPNQIICFETISVPAVDLAAGSLFVGNFITVMSNPIESPRFGRPFVGRPSKLTGKYKYFPQIITIPYKGDGTPKYPEYAKYKGQMDRCIIWMNLEDWEGATVRPKNPRIVARGVFQEYATVDKYKDFEVKLEYRERNRKPTHLVLVFSSSEFGDYYTGGVGTKMFVTDLQLNY